MMCSGAIWETVGGAADTRFRNRLAAPDLGCGRRIQANVKLKSFHGGTDTLISNMRRGHPAVQLTSLVLTDASDVRQCPGG
jgi:hypothetical protein